MSWSWILSLTCHPGSDVPTSLRVCNCFCHGSIGTSGCGNPSHECGTKGILSFENLVDCFCRYTPACDKEISHFIAFVTSCIRSWTVPPSRGMLAVTTVPAIRLERIPLRASLVSLLCILISDKIWPVLSRCETLNLWGFDSCNSRFVVSFKEKIPTAFWSERVAPSSYSFACNCLPSRRR